MAILTRSVHALFRGGDETEERAGAFAVADAIQIMMKVHTKKRR